MRQFKISNSYTNRESTSIEIYLREVSHYNLLTIEEEFELAKRIKTGDTEALEKLIRGNLRFVISVAKKYQHRGLALPDLINEGNIGLIRAAEKFDETKGFKFISYSVWWIRQSILIAIAENARIVRLPLNKISSVNKVYSVFGKLEQEYEREPSPEELAEILNLDIKEIEDSLNLNRRHLSIDAPISNSEEPMLLADVLKDSLAREIDDNLSFHDSLRRDIESMLSSLPERQKEIVKLSFGIGSLQPMSLDDIAQKLKLTVVRVRQIINQTIEVLQANSRNRQLKVYLGH